MQRTPKIDIWDSLVLPSMTTQPQQPPLKDYVSSVREAQPSTRLTAMFVHLLLVVQIELLFLLLFFLCLVGVPQEPTFQSVKTACRIGHREVLCILRKPAHAVSSACDGCRISRCPRIDTQSGLSSPAAV
eukprot:1497702-Amphidinium_carterae.1